MKAVFVGFGRINPRYILISIAILMRIMNIWNRKNHREKLRRVASDGEKVMKIMIKSMKRHDGNLLSPQVDKL